LKFIAREKEKRKPLTIIIMIINQGDKDEQTNTFNKYAFACAIVASMVSIVSGYGT